MASRVQTTPVCASRDACRCKTGLTLSWAHFILAPLVATVVLAILMPASALASECDKWTNTAGGSWYEAANWSKGVPKPEDDVCIEEPGSYTVTIHPAISENVTVKSLTLGANKNTQTLRVESDAATTRLHLIATNGVSVGGHGAVKLTSSGSSYSTILAAAVTNKGTISVEQGTGGPRYLEGDVVNTGTVSVANGTTLEMLGKRVFTNGKGGVLSGGSTGLLRVFGEQTFKQGDGETSLPVALEGGSLLFEGNGKGSFSAYNSTSTISGNIVPGQSLKIEGGTYSGGNCGCNARVLAAGSFTNEGSIKLTTGSSTYSSTLALTSGTLTNAATGTISVEQGTGGPRYLEGDVVNTGTVSVANGTTLEMLGKRVFTNGKGGVLFWGEPRVCCACLANRRSSRVMVKRRCLWRLKAGRFCLKGMAKVRSRHTTRLARSAGTSSLASR